MASVLSIRKTCPPRIYRDRCETSTSRSSVRLDGVCDIESGPADGLALLIVEGEGRRAGPGRRAGRHDPIVTRALGNGRDARSAAAVVGLAERALLTLRGANGHGLRTIARRREVYAAGRDADAAMCLTVSLNVGSDDRMDR